MDMIWISIRIWIFLSESCDADRNADINTKPCLHNMLKKTTSILRLYLGIPHFYWALL